MYGIEIFRIGCGNVAMLDNKYLLYLVGEKVPFIPVGNKSVLRKYIKTHKEGDNYEWVVR